MFDLAPKAGQVFVVLFLLLWKTNGETSYFLEKIFLKIFLSQAKKILGFVAGIWEMGPELFPK